MGSRGSDPPPPPLSPPLISVSGKFEHNALNVHVTMTISFTFRQSCTHYTYLCILTHSIGYTLMNKVVLNHHTLIDQLIWYIFAVCIGKCAREQMRRNLRLE